MLASPIIFYVGVLCLAFVIALYSIVRRYKAKLVVARAKIASGISDEWLESVNILNTVIRDARRLGDRQVQADAYNDLGVCQLLLKRPEDAQRAFQSSLALRSESQLRQRISTLENLAGAFGAATKYDEAIATFELALAANGNSDDARKASILNNMGIVLQENKDFGAADEAFNKSLRIAEDICDDPERLVALCNLARLNRNMSLATKTIEFSTKGIPIAKFLNRRDLEAEFEANLGWAYEATGELNSARLHAERAAQLEQ